MADAAQSIAKLVPTAMAAGLLSNNIDYIRKKKKKSIALLGVENIAGLSMTQAAAGFTSW